ncbi:MAG: thioredoxin family protein [Opitutaceae bacterium]|nr:thioredoxin family protein [Opitutaceae bacterium]
MNLVRLLAAAFLLTFGLRLEAQVSARLVSAEQSVQPGRPFTIALELTHAPGWHTYWINAGTGYPTSISWSLPEGWKAGEISWPVPGTIKDRLGAVSGNGYDGVLLLPVAIDPGTSARPGETISLGAKVEWLMCEEQCIPGSADLKLSLPIKESPPAPNPDVRSALERQPMPQARGGLAEARVHEGSLTVRIKGGAAWTEPHFFSTDEWVQFDAPQGVNREGDDLLMTLVVTPGAQPSHGRIDGVLAYTDPAGARKGLAISEPIGQATPARWSAAFWSNLGFAFIGGLILNLMPCVFPVLGIKILGFVNQAGAERRKVTLHGLAFTAGVIGSFWTLAGLLALLRAGGTQLGWGFQLQSPEFVFCLAVLMLVFGLSMSGVFEFGLRATSVGSTLQSRSGLSGSLFSGVLATVVATPCSAPFLAPALGAALALPALESFLLFTVIGLGLSAPYLILSLFPALTKALPRPGAWMETFKQFMAFPLYATAGYLIWVFAGQVTENENALRNALLGLVLVALGVWVYGRYHTFSASPARARFGLVAGGLLLAGGIALGWPRADALSWKPWSPEAVAAAQREKRTVYVDFTARWCATCQTNKQIVFSSSEVLRLLKDKDVLLLKADWTSRNPAITAELARHGRSAVPFNLVYRPDRGAPVALPELLTPSIVIDALR